MSSTNSDDRSWPLLAVLPHPADFKPEAGLKQDPFVSGVYCLWDLAGQLVYIGQSAHIAARLTQHRREGKKSFHRATYYPVADTSVRLQVESIFILLAKPKYNRTVVVGIAKGGRVYDLTRRTFTKRKKADSEKAQSKA